MISDPTGEFCGEPHPDFERTGIRCDFEAGHAPMTAGPDSGPTLWSHGNLETGRYYWGNPNWVSDEDDARAWGYAL